VQKSTQEDQKPWKKIQGKPFKVYTRATTFRIEFLQLSKLDKRDWIKPKSFFTAKDTINRMKK
jgi:hypothetical protein